MVGIKEEAVAVTKLKRNSIPENDRLVQKSLKSPQSPYGNPNISIDWAVDTSIEKLYENLCELQSSDLSPSRPSLCSYGEESRIDSELHRLIGGEMIEVKIIEESNSDCYSGSVNSKKGILSRTPTPLVRKKAPHSKMVSEPSSKLTLKTKSSLDKPRIHKKFSKPNGVTVANKPQNSPLKVIKFRNGTKPGLDNPDVGQFLLKQAKYLFSCGKNYPKALELATRAANSFEKHGTRKPCLELVMCLHIMAAIYSRLHQHHEAIPILERSIKIPVISDGQEHAIAKFAGHMQLGDTYAMLGQLENSILYYTEGLEVQRHALGAIDVRFGETCRYVAEAHLQALQLDEAERLCQMCINIHKENGSWVSIKEASDRRLMASICEMKGSHESALEHLVLASMAMSANEQELEVGSIDVSIGDTYLSLARYDEATYSYQKALTIFKSSKGENHPSVAYVLIRLADLCNKIGKIKESKSYCENSLEILEKSCMETSLEEIAIGLIDVSAIYECMNELEEAVRLLNKALKIYKAQGDGQQRMVIAGIEAQIGVMYYMLGNFRESHDYFKKSVSKLRSSSDKKSPFLGIVLNQMGLACVQCHAINEAVDLFKEAKNVLEREYGSFHPAILGVCSNLGAAYDALGRVDDAIEILKLVVTAREEKVGTANPDVEDEKRRLGELLKEAGRDGSMKTRSLETLFEDETFYIS